MTRNYKLNISYDGTNYCGWQVQANGISIQAIIENQLKIILQKEVHVTGSGRTDAGVHAMDQVANFVFDGQVDLKNLHRSINALLPHDIRVNGIEEVPLSFHARFSPKGKTYYYHLHLHPLQSPFKRLYSLHVKDSLDMEAIKTAAKAFIGTHNFASFANQAHKGSASRDPIRTLYRLDIIDEEGGVCLQFEANGFLYKMVRNIVGTLLEVGEGKLKPEDVKRILESKDRKQAGRAAPPHGLFLMKVDYPDVLSTSLGNDSKEG